MPHHAPPRPTSQLRATPQATLWQRLSRCSGGVVQLLDVADEAEGTYFVQELCMGGSLQGLLEGRGGAGLDVEEVRQAGRGVARFLADAHGANVFYGDVKPAVSGGRAGGRCRGGGGERHGVSGSGVW